VEEMANYGITRIAVDYFHYGDFRYTNLKNAIAQACGRDTQIDCQFDGRPVARDKASHPLGTEAHFSRESLRLFLITVSREQSPDKLSEKS
jgi:hypothetical protein